MPLTKITGGEFDDASNSGLSVSGIITASQAFVVGNISRLDNSGRLGIGTLTPTSTVDIFGLQSNTGPLSANNPTGTLRVAFDGASNPGNYGSSVVFSQRWFSGSNAQVAVAQISGIKLNSDGNFGGGLSLFTSNQNSNNLSERFRIDNFGKIGIGTTYSPNARVDTSLDGIVANTTAQTRASTWGPNGIYQLYNSNGSSGSATGNEVLLLGSQSGGLGAIASGIGFGRENSGNWGTYLSFKTHSTSTATLDELYERLRIDSTGNVITPSNIGAGLDIGYKKIVTLSGTYAANTWYNTGIDRTTDTGIYLLNAWVDTYSAGGQSFQETYIGWFVLPNRSSNSTVADTITIHRAGHAPNAETLQFRTLREASASGGRIYLQWLTNIAYTVALDGTAGKNVQISIHRFGTALNNG